MKIYHASEICRANDRYYELTRDLSYAKGFWGWLDLIGLRDCVVMGFNEGSTDTKFKIPDKAVRQMDILLSPHYRTLFKAYLIKHGNNHEQSRHQGLHNNSRR